MACFSGSAQNPEARKQATKVARMREAGNGGARFALRTEERANTRAQQALALKRATAKPFDPSHDVSVSPVGWDG